MTKDTERILLEVKEELKELSKARRSVGISVGINLAIGRINNYLGIEEDLDYIPDCEKEEKKPRGRPKKDTN